MLQDLDDFNPIKNEERKENPHQNTQSLQERSTKLYREKDWQKILEVNDLNKNPSFELQASLRKGIPTQLRPKIWFYLTNIENFEKMHNENLYQKLKSMNCSYENDIKKDINRTFPDQEFFQNKRTQEQMRNILRAFSNYDNEVGYAQGMNYIVGNLLYHLNPDNYQNYEYSFGDKSFSHEDHERKCFWIFVYINYEKNWRELYKPGLPKIKHLCRYFEAKLKQSVPDILQHLENQTFMFNIADLFFNHYFITLFLQFTPFDFSVRVIDMFLLVGERILIEILLRMLTLAKDQILKLEDSELHEFIKQKLVIYCFKNQENYIPSLIPQPQTENLEKNHQISSISKQNSQDKGNIN